VDLKPPIKGSRIKIALNQPTMKNLKLLSTMLLTVFLLGSCAGGEGWSRKAKGAAVGGAAGAATGAAVGGTEGAVVGAAAGTVAGGAIGRKKDKKKDRKRYERYRDNDEK
jgi:hypothetical protein